MTRVEVVEQNTQVIVEEPYYVVRPETIAAIILAETTEVSVQTPAPEVTLVQLEQTNFRVVPEVLEVRVVSVGEQGPPGSVTYRVFDATWAANLLVSWSDYDLFRGELEGPNTLLTFTGASDGQRVILELTQDGIGNRAVTWPVNIRYGSFLGSVVLSTDPGLTDKFGFMYNAALDVYDLMAFAKGF